MNFTAQNGRIRLKCSLPTRKLFQGVAVIVSSQNRPSFVVILRRVDKITFARSTENILQGNRLQCFAVFSVALVILSGYFLLLIEKFIKNKQRR